VDCANALVHTNNASNVKPRARHLLRHMFCSF